MAGDTLRNQILSVRGWALFESGMARRVEVRLDGRLLGCARLAVPRPDVAKAYRSPDAGHSGFEFDAWVGNARRHTDSVSLTVACYGDHGEVKETAPLSLRLEPVAASTALRSAHKRRLLAITYRLDLGGAQLYLDELVRGLVRQGGFDVTLAALVDGVLRQRAEDLGLTVEIIPPWGEKSSLTYEVAQAELVAWARNQGFEAVLVNTLSAFGGADLAARLSLPCLWVIHESFPLELFWWAAFGSGGVAPAVKACAVRALRSSAALVFVAQATKMLFEHYTDPDRCVHLPGAVDVAAIDAYVAGNERRRIRQRLAIQPEEFLILCVGTVEPRKGQNLLLRTFQDMASKFPGTSLVFVGDRGESHGSGLREYAAQSPEASRIRVLPLTEDVYEWYLAGDLLVCASDVESLPRTVLEAMAFNLPVIATEVFGLPEIVHDGVTGYLCRANDRDSLAAALDRALADPPERRREIASAARRMVRERHDLSEYVTAFARLLDGLIIDREASPRALLRSPGSEVERIAPGPVAAHEHGSS